MIAVIAYRRRGGSETRPSRFIAVAVAYRRRGGSETRPSRFIAVVIAYRRRGGSETRPSRFIAVAIAYRRAGRSKTGPYIAIVKTSQYDDTMHVIRHNNKCVEKDMVVVARQVQPTGGDDLSKVITTHLAVDNATEDASTPLGAKRYVVRPWLSIIVVS